MSILVVRAMPATSARDPMCTDYRLMDAEAFRRHDEAFLGAVLPLVRLTAGVPVRFGGGVVVAAWNATKDCRDHVHWACMCATNVSSKLEACLHPDLCSRWDWDRGVWSRRVGLDP